LKVRAKFKSLTFIDQLAQLPPQLHKAIITSNGKLTPPYKYIDVLRNEYEKKEETERPTHAERKVLVLGSGYVVPPIIEYLLRFDDLISKVTVAGMDIKKFQKSFTDYLEDFKRDASKAK
jgi:hypothetical protein